MIDTGKLESIVGARFLAYVLNLEEDQNVESTILSVEQQEVLRVLHSQVDHVPQLEDPSGFAQYISLSRLGGFVPALGTSTANGMRRAAGAEIPSAPSTNDPVLDALLAVALDTWPSYLLPLPSDSPKTFWMSAPTSIYQHPANLPLLEAIMADPSLSKLFPGTESDHEQADGIGWAAGVQGSIVTNYGRGSAIQLIFLPGWLLSNAVFRTLIGSDRLEWETLDKSLAASLATLRRLADGKTADVPTLIGLKGCRVAEGVEVVFTSGKLRAPRNVELETLLNSGTATTAVFETSFPLRLLKIGEPSFTSDEATFSAEWSKAQPRIDDAHRSFRQHFDLARLALLLASTGERVHLATEVSRFVLDPTTPGGTLSGSLVDLSLASHEIDSRLASDIAEWHTTIVQRHVPSLDIGVRRLLAATTSRLDANDAFVDAVVCWENVFGTATETVFRVTGALAKLLEPKDLTRRQELQRELKKLYDKRSGLVHGGKEPSTKEAWQLRERAIELAANCLRAIYRDRPDLLPLTSADRSAQLLME